jgi:hypothetical protein
LKNWSPEHTKEIKAWLDIDNYRKLEDISLNALYHELWARALLYKPGPTDEEKKGLWVYMTEIFSGNPHLSKGSISIIQQLTILYSPPHIFITDITRLAELSVMALSVNLFTWRKETMNIVLIRLITKLMCHNSCLPYVRKRCCLKSILVVVLTMK